jgi:hypothetical protein
MQELEWIRFLTSLSINNLFEQLVALLKISIIY